MPILNFPPDSKESRSRISVSTAGQAKARPSDVSVSDSGKVERNQMVLEGEEEVLQGHNTGDDEKEEGEILDDDAPLHPRVFRVESGGLALDGDKENSVGEVVADEMVKEDSGDQGHVSACDMDVDEGVFGVGEVKEKAVDRVVQKLDDLDMGKEGRSRESKSRTADRKHSPARVDGRCRDKVKRPGSPEKVVDRSRPSKSPDSGKEKRKRSRSSEPSRPKSSHRNRSRSRDSGRGRRGRSRSRESGREKRVYVDGRRRSASRDSGHNTRPHKTSHEHSKRSGRSRSRARSPYTGEKRRHSRSRDSLRDRRGVEERGGEEMRESRGRRDERSFRDGRHHAGDRDRADRDRDKAYQSDRDSKKDNRYRSRKKKRERERDSKDHCSKDGRKLAALADEAREDENQEKYQERVALQLAAQEEDDVEKIKEESRRRRQAILAKYSRQRPQEQNVTADEHVDMFSGAAAKLDGPHTGSSCPVKELNSVQGDPQSNGGPESVSSRAIEPEIILGKEISANGANEVIRAAVPGGLGAGSPKSERSTDMFCDDIFGESPAGGRKMGKGDGIAIETSALTDNWDDAEGYYCFRIGEILDGRYEVVSSHGRGVFSTVVRARDLKAGRGEPDEIAIKIIRNNETMFKAGHEELVILKKLAGADPENRRHCVRLLSSFVYRNHLCLVFESLHMNLREILKKFGRNIGINLTAVRAYAKQLFIALKHLRNCGVLHCDIKPDNMLVNEAKNVLKLCDFGSAMFAGENEITPYLVSRFYRPPEIILGLPYDHALDMWSVGCCLFELYSGKMLFPGATNNDMLRLHMELMGPFSKKMLKKAAFSDQHFGQDYNFCASEEDPVTKKTVKRILVNLKPKDIGTLISGPGSGEEDTKLLANFKDLLEKIFILDPDKRIAVSQALNHPFITGK